MSSPGLTGRCTPHSNHTDTSSGRRKLQNRRHGSLRPPSGKWNGKTNVCATRKPRVELLTATACRPARNGASMREACLVSPQSRCPLSIFKRPALRSTIIAFKSLSEAQVWLKRTQACLKDAVVLQDNEPWSPAWEKVKLQCAVKLFNPIYG